MPKWHPPSLLSQSFLLSVWKVENFQTTAKNFVFFKYSYSMIFYRSGTTDHNCKINVHLYILFNILNGFKFLSFGVYLQLCFCCILKISTTPPFVLGEKCAVFYSIGKSL
jgi:hypothetical protein